MTDRPIDPERPRDRPFDRPDGVFGQGYRREDEEAIGRENADPPAPSGTDHPDLGPDNGRRASIDPRTGEVHGAGVGAGGGQPGEDFDSDAASGDGYPLTGGERTDERRSAPRPPVVDK